MSSSTTSCHTLNGNFTVESDTCRYTEEFITSDYCYETTLVEGSSVKPCKSWMQFRTERHVGRTGVMIVGLGGNNGTTCVAGAIANQLGLTWDTKDGTHTSNYWGSLLLASTTHLGCDRGGTPVYTPMRNLLPLLQPEDIVWGGWDINSAHLGEAMTRARVLDMDLQRRLYPYMKDIVPLPSIYVPDFIAANQGERANHVLTGTTQEWLDQIRSDIRTFKGTNRLDKVMVLWCANTERYATVESGVNDTATNLLQSIATNNVSEVSPSTIFAVSSILEGCTFINGSPQNTFVPGVIDLACQRKVFIAGDDFKSGQTRMKTVMVDYLVSAGIKPVSIVSYNHLGNNDGKNLSAPSQFHSKEVSKSNVVDDMVASNRILYSENETPDHVVVIKYVPYVGDSKRAMDEYTSEIFMGGTNTIVMHNTCEDSLLATPLIYDLVILGELCERVRVKKMTMGEGGVMSVGGGDGGGGIVAIDEKKDDSDVTKEEEEEEEWEPLHPVLSLLSYMLKAPLVPPGAPVVNALFTQRCAIVNFMRACLGLPPDNHMTLEHKFESTLLEMSNKKVGSIV